MTTLRAVLGKAASHDRPWVRGVGVRLLFVLVAARVLDCGLYGRAEALPFRNRSMELRFAKLVFGLWLEGFRFSGAMKCVGILRSAQDDGRSFAGFGSRAAL